MWKRWGTCVLGALALLSATEAEARRELVRARIDGDAFGPT